MATTAVPQKKKNNSTTMKSFRPIRGRDMLTNSNSVPSASSASNLFERQGDSKSALEVYRSIQQMNDDAPSFSQVYNQSLLSYLSTGGRDDTFVEKINEWKDLWEKDEKNHNLPLRKKKRKEYVMLFNLCLVFFVSGEYLEAATKLMEVLKPMIVDNTPLHEDLLDVVARMAFLVLDCVLKLSEGSCAGLHQVDSVCTSDAIVDWLETKDLESESQLKFLLMLYRSRLDFAERHQINNYVEAKVRGVKKDLKQAMDIFNNKLRSTGETSSVGSASDVQSDMGDSFTRERFTQPSVEIGTQEGLLQAHNQAALNLKAQLEQLKGNTKKSLVLCTEAKVSHLDPSYECFDANNLAIVYAISHKKYLALHTAAKALRAPKGGLFRTDGTARSDETWTILANTSICAFQARRYDSAYECMATCVQNSSIYFKRPRCWLRMAEACIGMHVEKRREEQSSHSNAGFSIVSEDGKPKAILAHMTTYSENGKRGGSNERLGSKEDLEYAAKYPLQQASFCLDKVMKLLRDASVGASGIKMDRDCLESARCAQAYVMLELKEFKQALFLAKLLLMDAATRKETPGIHHIMHKRRRATASLYGCEACCALGDAVGALKFLTGETDDDAVLDRLAVDLAGISTNSHLNLPATLPPETEGRRKGRIKQAQAMVRTSASAATAAMGRLGTAKQLAMSAINLEDNAGLPPTDASRISARKALLYCMLREGNHDGALAVLRSTR